MNIKKVVTTVFAATALTLSGGLIGVAQTAQTSTTSGTVQVTDTGTFSAQFCDSFAFDSVTINSLNPGGTSEGSLMICYTDTQADRGTFRTYLSAGHFVGETDHIANTNVKPKFMWNVAQGQWGTGVGDIGAMSGAANYSEGGYVNGSASAPSTTWNGGDLSTPQYVGYGNAGIGTGGVQYLTVNGNNYIPELNNGSVATIDLILTVPNGLDGGSYASEFRLDINPINP